jgi:hypothetical protein
MILGPVALSRGEAVLEIIIAAIPCSLAFNASFHHWPLIPNLDHAIFNLCTGICRVTNHGKYCKPLDRQQEQKKNEKKRKKN